MMRHGLRIQVGLEQADHQRIYSFKTDHEMKDERRNMETDTDEYRNKHKKAAKHSSTKPQLICLSEKIYERASKATASSDTVDDDKIPSITDIKLRGRRAMDKENLKNQMMEEESKAGTLRQKHLTPEDVKELADQTTLTNDALYVADPRVRIWRSRMSELLKVKFWDVPAAEMPGKLVVASETFVDWHHTQVSLDALKSKSARLNLVKKHLESAKHWGNRILGFVDDLGGFDQKGIHKEDDFSAFMRVSPSAFGDEVVMEPVEEVLVNNCKIVDPHYTYTAGNEFDSDDETDECVDGVNVEITNAEETVQD